MYGCRSRVAMRLNNRLVGRGIVVARKGALVVVKGKATLLVVFGAIVLALASCGTVVEDGGQGGAGQGSDQASGRAGNGDGPRMAFVPQIVGIPYYDGFEKGAEEAAQKFGIDYTQTGPSTVSSPEQLRIFESLVKQGYDSISISPLDPTSINGAISEAEAKGVTVTTSDADAPKSDREVFVAQATDKALGYTVMDELAKQMGEDGQFGIVSGVPDTASLDSWANFIQERAKDKYPDIELVGGVRNSKDSAEALQEAQNLMTAYPDIEGIVAVPSTAVPGVSQAVQNAGNAGKVSVIGYGSPNTARPFIKSGVMKNTVLWDVPQLGYLTVWATKQLLDGKEFEETNQVPGIDHAVKYDAENEMLILGPPKVFDKSNVDDYDF